MKTKKNFKHCFFLLVVLLCLPIYAQAQVNVSGTVQDEAGVPLPGVSIIIKNSSTGTTTDFDGNYSIKTASTDILVFNYLGYKKQEVSVNGRSSINVTMVEEAGVLDEVVVIGYGSTTRRDLTGAVASVTGEKLAAVPVPDVGQALQGKLPGVRVITQDGRPGAEIAIRVRGGGSISQSNDPLFIVDGFPVASINNIPSNQIKSIDVLKDASAAAIYGARGANGVVIITTKNGVSGKPKVTYDGFTQFSVIPDYIPVMNGYDYIAFNWAYADAIGSQYTDAWEKLWLIGGQNGSNSQGIDYYRNVSSRDYTKELYNSAFTHNHSINLSGGDDNTKYLLAVNHIDQEGNKVGSSYKRSNVQLRLDQDLSDKLKFSLNTRYAQISVGDNGGNSQGYWFRPIDSADVLGDSDVTSNTQLGDYNGILQDEFSPIAQLNSSQLDNVNRSLVANTSLSWEIIDGLTAKTNFSLSNNWRVSKEWNGGIANTITEPDGTIVVGNASIQHAQGWNYRWFNTLNYEVQGLGEDHKLSVMAGMEVAESGSESTNVYGQKFPEAYDAERAWANMDQFLTKEGEVNFDLGSNIGQPFNQESYFGQLNYAFKDKYLLTGTFRADGSSRFASANQWGYFPAGALAWRASEEDFLKDVSWLDDLKVRVSYGSVGNDDIGNEKFKQSWFPGTTRYSINEVRQARYNPAAEIANPDIKWETTITRNLGIDYTLFGGRLNGAVEVYKNTVEDLIFRFPVSGLTGFEATYANVGSTSNKGVEISFSGDIIRTEDFNLSGSFNINFNKNNVDQVVDAVSGPYSSAWAGVRLQPSQDYSLEVGEPVGLMRGFVYEGWYTTDDFDYDAGTQTYTLKAGVPDLDSGILGPLYGTVSNKPGDQVAYPGVQKLRDSNGDGIINFDDVGIIGDPNPVHTGGFSLNGNYKNFDFGLDFTWSYGNDIYNATHLEAYLGNKESGLFRNRIQELAGHYKIHDIVNGQLTRVVEPAALDALNANASTYLPYGEYAAMSSFAIEDGSYLRLNTATLGYTLPQGIVDKFGINRFRVYSSIFNVFTLTDYSGFDPEVNVNEKQNSTSYPTPGWDYGAYPRSRSFTFGVNIEF
ncbi:SusC/RagA family TonB-linked outer membrane protein [Flavisericum labens]|uniref:SusC/RagA family TonB-linked outer membrane protein n=1 Tax=Flavisericum labens TaxID=3377112 RepID=UPI00387B881E